MCALPTLLTFPSTQTVTLLKTNLFVVQDTSDSYCVPIQGPDPPRSPFLAQIHHNSREVCPNSYDPRNVASFLKKEKLEDMCSELFAALSIP